MSEAALLRSDICPWVCLFCRDEIQSLEPFNVCFTAQIHKPGFDLATWLLGTGRTTAAQVDPSQVARQAASSQLFRFAAVSALCFGIVVGVHHLEPLRGIHSQTQQVTAKRVLTPFVMLPAVYP